MGFLNAKVELAATKFRQEHLLAARKFLTDAIARHDPEWLRKPEGRLGWYWHREDIESVCFLIHFADIFGTVGDNITQKSAGVFLRKLKELLRTKHQERFEETLLEMQFARALCDRASPISFEPLVPIVPKDAGKQTRSPDYAIRLPDGDVLIEITTFHFGALETWIRATKLLSEQLRYLLKKRRLSRTISVAFPLEFDSLSLLPTDLLVNIVDEMSNTDRGKIEIQIRRKKGILEWQPILLFDKGSQTLREAKDGELPPILGFAYGFQPRLLEDDQNELFLKSLRNALDRKREQGSKSSPYVVVLGLGHHSLHVEEVMAAVRARIWPNRKYRWLTGLLVFTPARGFLKADQPPTLNYFFNPNAKVAPTKDLVKLLDNKAKFHLRNGKFCPK
jgi:hypothetical protein